MRTKYRYPDRASYKAALEASERRTFLWQLASEYLLSFGSAGGPDTQSKVFGRYTAILCGPQRCDGGVILLRYYDGRPASCTAYDQREIWLWRQKLSAQRGDADYESIRAALDWVLERHAAAQREEAVV